MTRKLKAIIIDDEPNSVDFIVSLITEYCPELEIAGKAFDVSEGIRAVDYILKSINIKEFQDILDRRSFFRPHNSHLINLKYVRKYIRKEGGYIEMQDSSQIPVSRSRKDLFLKQMSRFRG